MGSAEQSGYLLSAFFEVRSKQKLASGDGGETATEVGSASIDTSSIALDSWMAGFESAWMSALLEFPILGEAILEAAVVGSRLAVRAAFRRFSASSLARRSCSCIDNAAD